MVNWDLSSDTEACEICAWIDSLLGFLSVLKAVEEEIAAEGIKLRA